MIYLAFRTKIWLRFDETQEELAVCSLPGSSFRLAETPVLASQPVFFGDIIDTTLLPDSSHRFDRVVAPAPFNHYSWFLSSKVSASHQLKAFAEEVESSGGHWEQIFGGLFHVHMPIESTFDGEVEMMRLLEAIRVAPREQLGKPLQGNRRLSHLKYL